MQEQASRLNQLLKDLVIKFVFKCYKTTCLNETEAKCILDFAFSESWGAQWPTSVFVERTTVEKRTCKQVTF